MPSLDIVYTTYMLTWVTLFPNSQRDRDQTTSVQLKDQSVAPDSMGFLQNILEVEIEVI